MRALQHDIQQVLASDGVIVRRDHPKLRGAIDWLIRNGGLCSVLPGVYSAPGTCSSINTRIRALMRWDPDAVLVGAIAAHVSFWPDLHVDVVDCAVRHNRAPNVVTASLGGRFRPSWWQTGSDCAARHPP